MAPKAVQQKPGQSGVPDYNWQDLKSILPEHLVGELSRNHAPSKGALQYVKAARANPAKLLQAAKQRACRLGEQIKKFQAEQAILADEPRVRGTLKNVFDAISSPIRRLPDDIIREIVHHATKNTYPSPQRTSTVIALARVCSTWRSVVLSSPRLWSILYLRMGDISHYGIMQYHQAVQTWFCRAGLLPLQLFLYFDLRGPLSPTDPEAYVIKLLLKSLAPWTSRIYRLGIGSHDWMDFMAQFADVAWDLCNLQRLDILGQKAEDDELLEESMASLESVADHITLFRNSSQLTTLVASQEISAYLRRLPLFPWQQITNMSLDEQLCNEFEVSTLLRHCPQLRNAQLHVNTQHEGPLPNFVHNNLEALQLFLKIGDYDKIPSFFAPYCFPNLTSLWIELDVQFDEMPPEPSADFRGFVPFPSLHTLVTKGEPLPTSLMIDMLQNAPLLRSLNMEIPGGLSLDMPGCDINELCQSMTLQRCGQRDMVPLLKECSFHYDPFSFSDPSHVFAIDAALVAAFVRSRIQNVSSTSTHLRKAVFSGGFRILTNIDEDISKANVLEISSRCNFSVKKVHPRIPLPADLQTSAFSQRPGGDWYRWAVNHTHIKATGSDPSFD